MPKLFFVILKPFFSTFNLNLGIQKQPMRNLAAFYLLLIGNFCFAQNDTLPPHLNKEDLIESFLQEQDSDAEFDYNDLFEELDYLYQKTIEAKRY